MDNQIRVIDHDAGDRTTSEGQAYGMFFALVANDRSRFDGLLKWTEKNLAAGDMSEHLPAWLWGHGANDQWGVLDNNSAADADLWMSYTLLEAGKAWNEPRYTELGTSLAHRIAREEVADVPGLGTMLVPGQTGFQRGSSYRLNASYVPVQLVLQLARLFPDGPWKKLAATVPALVKDSAPHGYVSDWTEFNSQPGAPPSPSIGSYDAIRVYLWAGMLDKSTPHKDDLLKVMRAMADYLHSNEVPPAKVRPDGSVEDPKGPVGFSAALLPYALALHEQQLPDEQLNRLHSEFKAQTGLFGSPARYYDQNMALFGIGFYQHEFSFDSKGALDLHWKHS